MSELNELSLHEAMQELVSAEDFLDYFGVSYTPETVNVNRLHILQRFHDYLNAHPASSDEDQHYAHYRHWLTQAYTDFTTSDALTEKVFAVFKKASGIAVIPVNAIRR